MKKVFGFIFDFVVTHKFVAFTIGVIALFVVSIALFTNIRTTSDRAVSEARRETNTEVSDANKDVREVSKAIPFTVPMAEDIIDAISEQEKIDGELTLEQTYAFILQEFGDEVNGLLMSGWLPSREFDRNINRAVLDTIKSLEVPNNTTMAFQTYTVDNTDYVLNGERPRYIPTLIPVESGYTLVNQNQGFMQNDLYITGLHVHHTNIDGEVVDGLDISGPVQYNNFGEYSDSEYLAEHINNNSSFTRVTYFVRPTKEMDGIKFMESAGALELEVNEVPVPENPEPKDVAHVDANRLFGTNTSGIDYEDSSNSQKVTVLESGVAVIHRYIPQHALQDSNNKITVNGSEYNLQRKSNEFIDLSTMFND